MRIDVKKYVFVGLEDEREAFFKKAQDAGIVQFIEKTKNSTKGLPTDVSNVSNAIKILRGLPTAEQEDLDDFSQADSITSKILQLKDKLEKLEEEQRVNKLEIARVGIFGNFSSEDIAYIKQEGHKVVQFFFAKKGIFTQESLPGEVVFIASDHGLDYYIAINDQPMQYDKMVEMRIEHPLGALKARAVQVEQELHQTEKTLKTYAKYNKFLHHALIYKLNSYHLTTAQNGVESVEQNLFAIEGWVPVDKQAELHALVDKMHVYVEEIAIEPTDAIPTYLENEGVNKIGEDIIGVYDVPSHADKDPSLWVLIWFSFFFAFIVGDAGYGLVFLAVAMYIRYKSGTLTHVKKRMMNLFFILCFSCIAWGLLVNSFFGISFGPDSPIRKVSLLHWLVEKKAEYLIETKDATYQEWADKYPEVKNATTSQEFLNSAVTVSPDGSVSYDALDKFSDNIMLELALLIGVIHIVFSLLRYMNRNWSHLGWVLFIIGGYLYFPYYLKATSIPAFLLGYNQEKVAMQGLYLMLGGLSLAVIISVVKNKFLGLLEIMTSIQIFSDILSYLRLYALAMAGAIVGATTNEAMASVTFVVGIVLVIIGHGVNILLSAMGGVIHGLRLNFLEWYHYSFEGGGKKFTPLSKQRIE
jgi:V/A-type H+-transporting ATPase subunit I